MAGCASVGFTRGLQKGAERTHPTRADGRGFAFSAPRESSGAKGFHEEKRNPMGGSRQFLLPRNEFALRGYTLSLALFWKEDLRHGLHGFSRIDFESVLIREIRVMS